MWEYEIKLLHPWNPDGLWRILRWRADGKGLAADIGRFKSKGDAETFLGIGDGKCPKSLKLRNDGGSSQKEAVTEK